MNDFKECIFIEIPQVIKVNILVGCIYRPPDTNIQQFNVEFIVLLDIINSGRVEHTFIACDYNIDLLKRDNHVLTEEFINNLISSSFLPTIFRSTRITNSSATLIHQLP